jgi:hypothetical protein
METRQACAYLTHLDFHSSLAETQQSYAAVPAMIEALWPPKPKLLLITVRSLRSRGVFGV